MILNMNVTTVPTLQDSKPGNEQVDPAASRVRFLPRHRDSGPVLQQSLRKQPPRQLLHHGDP